MSESTTGGEGTIETRQETARDPAGVVKFWLEQIDLASKDEEAWRKEADEYEAIYKGGEDTPGEGTPDTARRWNILYSNTETITTAIYNSQPVPDIRRRFSEQDDDARVVATTLERALSFSMDEYDPDVAFRGFVKDGAVPGRGVVRVDYDYAEANGQLTGQRILCRCVDWRSFRRGAAKRWDDVTWIAFRHYLTRTEMEKLNPTVGKAINLDYALPSAAQKADKKTIADSFKRGEVWEIWDKDRRELLFIAPAHPSEPLRVKPDPYGLSAFFPVPRPFMPVEVPNSLVPVPLYRMYKRMANELETLTERIIKLARAIRFRGAYLDPKLGDFLAKFEKLDDGDLAPMEQPRLDNDVSKAFWTQPIREAVEVLIQMYQAREQAKQTIYEITGIADLLRGQSQASETATAQNIKAQWGSLRVSGMQAEVQRVIRDVMRLKVELIAEHFQPQTLAMMTGVQLTPQQIMLMKSDPLRRYRVDVETDSTIRADLQRQQQNISGFVQGFGGFIQAIGPAVQAGAMPMNVVAEMVKSFSRTFKLGRAVEEALDSMPTQTPEQPDPKAAEQAAAQAEAQAAMQSEQMKAQTEQAKLAADAQKTQATLQQQMALKQMEIEAEDRREVARMQFEAQKHSDQMMIEREKLALDVARTDAEHEARERDAERSAEREDRTYGLSERKQKADEAASRVRVRDDGEAETVEEATAKKLAEAAGRMAEAVDALATAAGKPRKIVRGPDNRMTEIRPN